MLLIMFFLIACYVLCAFYIARIFYQQSEYHLNCKIIETENIYQLLLAQKEEMEGEKKLLEKETAEIFSLYEMTKEITKKVREEEAFDIFKTKLKENVFFEDCRFVSASSQIPEKNEKQFIFPLNSKKEKLGYLAVRGLRNEDKEKAMILGHQFVLALRRVKLYHEIEELAMTDGLTNVHTRRYFLERFEEELKRSTMKKIDLSFLMIDVDDFKNFNDQFGHLAGDQILREAGRIIKENVREIDIAGRFGGEEFCVVLPVTDRKGANFAAERIRAAIESTPIKAYDASVKITVSIGIASFPQDGKSTDALIDKADWALYRAKKKGKNCICAFGVYEE